MAADNLMSESIEPPWCQSLLQKIQHWTTGQLHEPPIARAKHQDSKTPHLEEYRFLVAGALALAMVSWTSTGRLFIKALGPVWAIPTTSRALVEDARSCPEAGTAGPAWSESPKGADTGGDLSRVIGKLRENRGIGMILRSKEVHFRFAKQIPNLG